jgi:O-antigen ligase/polysaccharide polymerase Wzy-like membrane protein
MFSDTLDFRKLFYVAIPLAIGGATYLAFFRPAMVANMQYILAGLGLIALAALAYHYASWMPVVLVGVFLWGGSSLPLKGGMQTLRWVVLAAAAFLGLVAYLRNSGHLHFGSVHLVALFVVLAAFASALGSVNFKLTALKSASLALLVLYGSVGARVSWQGNPDRLVKGIVWLAEILTYVSAVSYLIFSYPLWGNPNSLGVVTGLICLPILLWHYVAREAERGQLRRIIGVLLSGALLFLSFARAGMLSAGVASIFLLVSARRYRLLAVGIAVFSFTLLTTYTFWPEKLQETSESLLYKKGDRSHGVMQSREGPWQASIDSFKQHPWLGLGFGAAEKSAEWEGGFTTAGKTRERGSSYLTVLEGVGLVGTIPLAMLLAILLFRTRQVFAWLRVTRIVDHPSVPVAMVVVAGLVHAGFEDWLLAVGYHMSVVFWALALSLPDLAQLPARIATPVSVPATAAMGAASALPRR